MPKVSEAHRNAMRSRILDAAADVLARKGYGDTTLRDIAAQAQVSLVTCYSYFEGKADVIAAATERALAAYVGMVGLVSEQWTVAELMTRTWDDTAPERAVLGALLSELRVRAADEHHAELIRRTNVLVVESTRPVLERMQAAGSLVVDDIDATLELNDLLNDALTRRAAIDAFVTSWDRIAAVVNQLYLTPPTAPGVAAREVAAPVDPAEELRAAVAMRRKAEQLELEQVQRARLQGWSWEQIAQLLGISKQAAHHKYAARTAGSPTLGDAPGADTPTTTTVDTPTTTTRFRRP